MNRPTLADQLIEILRQAGVARVYGVAGDSLNPVVDAIRRTEGIEWVHVRNEEAGAFAAAAEAQLTGRLAVWTGSRKPRNTHLIHKIYDAHRSGAPVLAIASHITSARIGMDLFQQTRAERLFVECSQYQTDHAHVDYAAIAGAAGIYAVRVADRTDVCSGLAAALAHPGPALVNLVTDPNALSIPPHITAAEVRGFALARTKIVLEGGVGGRLDLARANVRSIPRPAHVDAAMSPEHG